ncbi:GntR family transcriptional regulator [Acrocarpospora sp. B8E8]|uniref:GntR family transcriptional regulator n=1 Tax=Acrocarpospora sp. B8E8 TaxID=3153572 RepID=UPI00325F81BB
MATGQVASRLLGALSLPGVDSSVSVARRYVATVLRNNGFGRIHDVVLLASELVTHALAHSESGCSPVGRLMMTVSADGASVRVEVIDQGSTSSRPSVCAHPHPDSSGGWGLWLVEQISTAWGFRDHELGRAVWFTLEAPRSLSKKPKMNGDDMSTATGQETTLLIPEPTVEPIIRRKPPTSAQIAELLAAQISSGALAKGEPIPTIHELMSTHDVSRHTATNAQHRLCYRDLIHLLPGDGYVVSDPDEVVQIVPAAERVGTIVQDIISRIQSGEIPGHRNLGPRTKLRAEHGLSRYAAHQIMIRLTKLGWAYCIIHRGTYSVPPHFWPTKSIHGISRKQLIIYTYDSMDELEARLAAHLGFTGEHTS